MRIKLFIYTILGLLVVSAAQGAGQWDEEAEKQWLTENVIAGNNNIYGDSVPITATDRILRKAWKELSTVDDPSLADYAAVFYIFPEEGEPIILPGALAPAGSGPADLHAAVMHMRVTPRDAPRLGRLNERTIVYAVDGSGSKAWFPFRFFKANSIYPGYMSSEGFYMYTYRPSAKLQGRYGLAARYLDLVEPGMLEAANNGLEQNLTLLGIAVPDDIARVAWFSRAAFYAPLLKYMADRPELAAIRYNITLKADEADGYIEVKVPFRLQYGDELGSVAIYPDMAMFEALEALREAVAKQLEKEYFHSYAGTVRGLDLVVTHLTANSFARVTKSAAEDAAWELSVHRANNDLLFDIESHSMQIEVAKEAEGGIPGYLDNLIVPRTTDPSTALAAVSEDWKSRYDTDIRYEPRKRRTQEKPAETDSLLSNAYKYYELDIQPRFRGGDFNSFCEWLFSEIQMPRYPGYPSEEEFYDRAVIDFVIDEQGRIIAIEEVESSWDMLFNEAVKTLYRAKDDWTPGEVAGVPVKVVYRIAVGM